ncbi:hypothetical protein CCACVL1_25854 [Corchorus capsularis]|uniref:Uncharacterized protein n=1 Tax=Corchorus capsularis TaxID=210143 RepID=A0A1R3GGV1_COCAP|nr:hypothetical protein CCACVL1_25854 [Corchorus capsularis]
MKDRTAPSKSIYGNYRHGSRTGGINNG